MTAVHDADGVLGVVLEPDVPLRFPQHPHGTHPWSAHTHWAGTTMLQLNRADDAYGVWKFFDEGGTFTHWYINFERPLQRGQDDDGSGWLATHDHGVDIVIRDGGWQWKDDEDPAAMVESGRISSAEYEDIRREGRRVAALLEAGAPWWRGLGRTGSRPAQREPAGSAPSRGSTPRSVAAQSV